MSEETASLLETLLERWQVEPTIRQNIVEWRSIPARQARASSPFPPLFTLP